ncbi:MAG: hypothetical protein ACE5FH_09570 [Candidatus Zixiibacteriota bacterium]
MSVSISIWIAALLTLGIYSFLYKDNPVYKFCEAVFVGCSAGYWAVVYFWDNLDKKFWTGVFPDDGSDPQYVLWFGAFLGLFMLARLIPKIGWLSRWPLSFIVGATAGLYMMLYFVSNGLNQVASTLAIPREAVTGAVVWGEVGGALVIAVGVFTGLIYFFFSKEHKGLFGASARVGIWFLMATFGAHFGYTVMSRMSLLIGRVDFLFRDWLRLLN